MAHSSKPTPWTQTMALRPEIIRSGHVDDVQVSLAAAVFGNDGDPDTRSDYARPGYYGDITHPTGRLVDLMAKVKLRLNSSGAAALGVPAVWRLDQAMGGGKSHGLIGLWHLAENPDEMVDTELGREVAAKAAQLGGRGAFDTDFGRAVCVVMDCDNPAPSDSKDGPAKTLGERFLWRLFRSAYRSGAYRKWDEHRHEIVNKAKIAEVLRGMGVPVLILIDEVMDYLRWAGSQLDSSLLDRDMVFLRSLLDAVNDVDNCVLVMVMIASDKDTMALTPGLDRYREELESLLVRNGTTTTVTSGGDFGAILRRRLFTKDPPTEVVKATAEWYVRHMKSGGWVRTARDAKMSVKEFERRLKNCYPFHPSLIMLAQDYWSQHAGFQKVRSTIQVFAGAVHALSKAARPDGWLPPLIGPGDLVLDDTAVREALLSSGLVAGSQIQSNLREICTGDICDPDSPDRGTARAHDIQRREDPSSLIWASANPRASERAATALLVYTLSPRPQAARGATAAELLNATFVPDPGYTHGDAEVVWQKLQDPTTGLAALDSKEGSGHRPKRWWLETRATLRMLHRRELESVTDAERDAKVTEQAIADAVNGQFNSVRKIVGDPERVPPNVDDLCDMIKAEGIDDGRSTRLVILDSRWFSLLNGVDADTRSAVKAAFGIPEERTDRLALDEGQPARMRPMTWASSCVFAVINTQMRARARRLAREFLAAERVESMDLVKNDDDMSSKANKNKQDIENRFREYVKRSYQHVLYLAEDVAGSRVLRDLILSSQSQTALDGAAVWDALCDEGKTLPAAQPDKLSLETSFDSTALLHNLRDADWGRPLSEIRDDFWKAPRLPLLAGGESDLKYAIHQAVTENKMRIVDEHGSTRSVSSPSDVNLASTQLRIARPAPQPDHHGVSDFDGDSDSSSRSDSPYDTADIANASTSRSAVAGSAPGQAGHQQPFTTTSSVQPEGHEFRVPVKQVSITIRTRFEEPSERERIYEFLNMLTTVVDESAEYTDLQATIVAPSTQIEQLTAAAENSGIICRITDV